jgi:hypothetical protein
VRIGFFRRSQGQQADGSAWREASKTCSNGQELNISGFMICVTRLHPGNELAKILGHSNIKMTERYAKLARRHIARTSSTAREMWKLMEPPKCGKANVG